MWKRCVYAFQIEFSPPLLYSFVLLSPNSAPLTFFPFISSESHSSCLKIPLVAGGKVSRQVSFVALSAAWISAASPPTPSPSYSPPSFPPPASEILFSQPCPLLILLLFPSRENRSWHLQRKDKNQPDPNLKPFLFPLQQRGLGGTGGEPDKGERVWGGDLL